MNSLNFFGGLVITSATAEHEAPGSIYGLGEVMLDFSIRKFPVAARIGNRETVLLRVSTGVVVRKPA